VNRGVDTTLEVFRDRDLSLCRSLLYEALSLGFIRPSERTCQSLVEPDAVAALAEAAALVDDERSTQLARATLRLANRTTGGSLDSLTAIYERLFGHTVRGSIPAYETEYGRDTPFQKPQELSDIAAFLRAFGLAVNPGKHERIDHISCELEFLAFLARKEAHAIEIGDAGMRSETHKAARSFLKDHLGRFGPAFARRAISADPGGFYGDLAALCLAFVTSECARLAVPLGPETLRLRAPIDDQIPMACGGPDSCLPESCDLGSEERS
jgi:TorA maturation chaperone TorD